MYLTTFFTIMMQKSPPGWQVDVTTFSSGLPAASVNGLQLMEDSAVHEGRGEAASRWSQLYYIGSLLLSQLMLRSFYRPLL